MAQSLRESEGQRIAQSIVGELGLALAATEEADRLIQLDDSPFTRLHVTLYSDRCRALRAELRQLTDKIATIVHEAS